MYAYIYTYIKVINVYIAAYTTINVYNIQWIYNEYIQWVYTIYTIWTATANVSPDSAGITGLLGDLAASIRMLAKQRDAA